MSVKILTLLLQIPNGDPVIWAKNGKLRFYFDRSYDSRTRNFRELPQEGKDYHPPETSIRESEFQEIARPLRTFDLFSGCGGLSHGLEQSGCAKVQWAVEIDAAAADSFEVNVSSDYHLVLNQANVKWKKNMCTQVFLH